MQGSASYYTGKYCMWSNLAPLPDRYWDHEVQTATKDMRKSRLIKAIIKCYWKPYAVLGFFTFIEVSLWKCTVLSNRL